MTVDTQKIPTYQSISKPTVGGWEVEVVRFGKNDYAFVATKGQVIVAVTKDYYATRGLDENQIPYTVRAVLQNIKASYINGCPDDQGQFWNLVVHYTLVEPMPFRD